MASQSNLLVRVEKAVGPAPATMFVESGEDRHFIFELSIAGVALYLLGKYVDGFIKGLGIEDLGEKHGKAVADAIKKGAQAFSGDLQAGHEDLEKNADALSLIVNELRAYRSNPDAVTSGLSALRLTLMQQGLPESEADRITENVVGEIWK